MTRTTRTRRGTTLVELLVAAAMLMLGMWLLVWLYQQGMASFINAKAQADLTTQERTVTTVMTRDLGGSFFLDEDAKPNRGRRLSNQRTDLGVNGGWTPPRGGFFWARSIPPGNNNVLEATDSDGFTSVRAVDHCLQFTILLPGGANYQQLGAEVQPGTGIQYFGTAAEVTYVLVPNGATTTGGVPLYDLIRRQRLTALTNDDTSMYQSAFNPYTPSISEVAAYVPSYGSNGAATGGTMQNLLNLTVPPGQSVASSRLAVPASPPYTSVALPSSSGRYGEDRLMSNVLSFEVKFTGTQTNLGAGAWPSDPKSIYWPRPVVSTTGGASNTDYPYDYLPYNGEFDTCSTQVNNWQSLVASATATTNPIKPIRITGILIRLRGYDLKNQTTRQTTIASGL